VGDAEIAYRSHPVGVTGPRRVAGARAFAAANHPINSGKIEAGHHRCEQRFDRQEPLGCLDPAQRLQQPQRLRHNRRPGPHISRQMSVESSQPPRGHCWPFRQYLVGDPRRRLDHIEGFVLPLGWHPLVPKIGHRAGEAQGAARILERGLPYCRSRLGLSGRSIRLWRQLPNGGCAGRVRRRWRHNSHRLLDGGFPARVSRTPGQSCRSPTTGSKSCQSTRSCSRRSA